jgi:hypothetical protein
MPASTDPGLNVDANRYYLESRQGVAVPDTHPHRSDDTQTMEDVSKVTGDPSDLSTSVRQVPGRLAG